MPILQTWAGRSRFSYIGSVFEGTKIIYGDNYSVTITGAQYASLLKHFRDATVKIGTSRDTPPRGSLGKWLQDNVSKTAIASYVGPILITEGYAVKIRRDEIQFVKSNNTNK